MIRVTVAFAAPGREWLADVTLPDAATVRDAVAASGAMATLALDPATVECAIFGRRTTAAA